MIFRQRVELVPGISMEEVVPGNPKDLGQLLVEVGHDAGLGWLLRHAHQAVDIFYCTEGLLP